MSTENYIENLEEFEKITGLLTEKQINRLKLKPLIGLDDREYDECGAIEANTDNLRALIKFVDKNPKYHIISVTEGDTNASCYSNQIRYVNRMKYYLGNGSKEDLECVDPDTIREECGACNGSGFYDVDGSPECGICCGTGEKPYG